MPVFFDESSVDSGTEYALNGIRMDDVSFTANYALSQLCVSGGLQAGEGGAVSFVGVSNQLVTINRAQFLFNGAIGSNEKEAWIAIGGAMSISQGSNVSCENCEFKGNAAVFGIGNDIISYSGEVLKDNDVYFNNCSFYNLSSTIFATVVANALKFRRDLCLNVQNFSAAENALEKKLENVLHHRSNKDTYTTLHDRKLSSSVAHRRVVKSFLFPSNQSRGGRIRNLLSSPQTEFNFSSDSLLLSFLPSVVISNGFTVFLEPLFVGEYSILFGDAISLGLNIYSALSNGKMGLSTIYGNIQNHLLITSIGSQVALIAMKKGMTVGQLNMFNATLFISNNIVISGNSFIANATIVGAGSSILSNSTFASTFLHKHKARHNRTITAVKYPTIRFKGTLLVGLDLTAIRDDEVQGLRDVIVSVLQSGNQNISYVTKFSLDACKLIIAGQMVVDAVVLSSLSKLPTNVFSGTTVLFELINRAVVNITHFAEMVLLTDTLFYTKNATTCGIVNAGSSNYYSHIYITTLTSLTALLFTVCRNNPLIGELPNRRGAEFFAAIHLNRLVDAEHGQLDQQARRVRVFPAVVEWLDADIPQQLLAVFSRRRAEQQ